MLYSGFLSKKYPATAFATSSNKAPGITTKINITKYFILLFYS